jgi:hypothetical protein
VGQDGGGVAVKFGAGEPGSAQPGSDDKAKGAIGCVVLCIILIDLLQAFVQCVVEWAKKKECTFWDNMLLKKLWEQDPPDPRDPPYPSPGATGEQLTAIADNPQAAQLINFLYQSHSQLWEAMDRAAGFLTLTGLIYPTRLEGAPVFSQFVAAPDLSRSFPHREESDPPSTFHLYPTSPLENPISKPAFAPGVTPGVIFSDNKGEANATGLAIAAWAEAAGGISGRRNNDLDADRGFLHGCWATVGSVRSDPVGVDVLDFTEQ